MSPKKKSNSKSAKAERNSDSREVVFRIGEVARLCRLPAYVLRFWETEFPQLKPVKSSTGQRMYRRRDVESVVRIKQLLYEEGYTIAGARQHLRDEGKGDKKQVGSALRGELVRQSPAASPRSAGNSDHPQPAALASGRQPAQFPFWNFPILL